MTYFFCFAAENDFLSLFSRVWIEVHFPLKGPVTYISKSLLRSFADIWVPCTTEKKEVSSANSFELVVRPIL